jgi:hypothetical protein
MKQKAITCSESHQEALKEHLAEGWTVHSMCAFQVSTGSEFGRSGLILVILNPPTP